MLHSRRVFPPDPSDSIPDSTLDPTLVSAQLYVPHLIPELAEPVEALARLPVLYRWLARSRKRHDASPSLEGELCKAFGIPDGDELPLAPLTLLGTGRDPENRFWLRADPVLLQPRRSELILVDARELRVTEAEAQSLVGSLNQHFAPDGLVFFAADPIRWFLRCPEPARLRTTSLAQAIGRSVDPLLPRGEDALLWHRRLNEAQMLLHDHPVNAAREAQGDAPINSVWIWGGGTKPRCSQAALRQVWAAAGLARGLARCAGLACEDAPEDAERWLDVAVDGDHLLLLGELDRSAPDLQAWQEQTRRLEQRWFAPLIAALTRRQLGQAVLVSHHAGQALRYVATAGDLWRIWRRSLGLPSPTPHA